MTAGKLFGAALGMALAASVIAGAGSASATVLCRAEAVEAACPAGKSFAVGTSVQLATGASGPLFVTSLGNVACGSSTTQMGLVSEGGSESPALAGVESILFFQCSLTSLSLPCTVELHVLPAQAAWVWGEGSNGEMALEAGESVPLLAIRCGAGNVIKCAYEFAPTMEVTGGNPGTTTVSEYPMEPVPKEGFSNCPGSTVLAEAAYRSRQPQQAFLAQSATGPPSPAGSALCKAPPTSGFCPSWRTYGPGQKFEAGSESVTFSAGGASVSCAESGLTLEAETTGGSAARASGEVSALTFQSCLTGEGKPCTVEAVNEPYRTELLYTTGSNGALALSDGIGAAVGPGIGFVSCMAVFNGCEYTTVEPLVDLFGGGSATATFAAGTMELAEGGVECPLELSLGAASYSFTSPTAIYAAKEVGDTSVLCKEAPSAGVCPEAQIYPAEQEIGGEAQNVALVTSGEDMTCETSKATFVGKAKGGPTEIEKGSITALSFEGCELTLGATCTVQAINLPYSTELRYTSGSDGVGTVKNGGAGSPGATVSCSGGLLACVFSAEPSLTVEGGNPATGVATSVTMSLSKEEGFMNCPEQATWSAGYKATNPTAVYVAGQ